MSRKNRNLKENNAAVETEKPALNAKTPQPSKGEDKKSSRNSRRPGKSSSFRQKSQVEPSFSSAENRQSNSIFFPAHKASTLTKGTFVNQAGQRNGIEDFSTPRLIDGWQGPVNITFDNQAIKTPNCMRLDVTQLFGSTDNGGYADSAIDQATRVLRQFISTSLGSQTSYDPQDIAPYVMACASATQLIAEIKMYLRMIIMENSQYPYFYPLHSLDLCGVVSPSELANWQQAIDQHYAYEGNVGTASDYYARHLSSTCDRLNMYIRRLNTLPMPAEMALFTINTDLFDAIYADSPNVQAAQTYIFSSTGTWEYVEDSSDDGAYVRFIPWPHYTLNGDKSLYVRSIDSMIDRLKEMIDAITSNTDSALLIQNITNAYGTQRLFNVIPVDYSSLNPLFVVYDEYMLVSIANTTLAPWVNPGGYIASASQHSVIGSPWLSLNPDASEDDLRRAAYMSVNLPLQFKKDIDSITPELIGRALRFHPAFTTYRRNVPVMDGDTVLHGQNIVYPGGCYGFALIQGMSVATLSARQSRIDVVDVTSRWVERRTQMLLADFDYCPPTVEADMTVQESSVFIKVLQYSSQREVELTLRYDEMLQWWIGETEIAWGTNIIRDIRGTRQVL